MTEPGILAVWNDADPAGEAEYEEWYEAEHLPERVGVPGFRFGRRYRNLADQASPRYFTFYETDSLGVLASPDYLARLDDPTEWTRRMMPVFQGMHRTACALRVRVGNELGAFAAVATLTEGDSAMERIPDLAAAKDVAMVQLWQADPETTGVDAKEMAYREGEDSMAEWVLFVGAVSAGALGALDLPGDALGHFRLTTELVA